MSNIGLLVWISARPLLKLALTTSCGYFLTKAGLFSPIAAKGVGQVLLNIFFPALLFSKIIPGFTAENLAALGPLVLIACIYHVYGFAIAWATKKVFWVPRDFRSGILAAGIWGNWGDIPTAVIMSMASSPPFSNGDPDRAVAYISAFVLVMTITMYPLGGYRIIARDFADDTTPNNTESDKIPELATSQLSHSWYRFFSALRPAQKGKAHPDVEELEMPHTEDHLGIEEKNTKDTSLPELELSRHTTVCTSNGNQCADSPPYICVSPVPTVVGCTTDTPQIQGNLNKSPPSEPKDTSATNTLPTRLKRVLVLTQAFFVSLASPITITIAISFTIALVPSLKALFVTPLMEPNVHISPAPDGLPPLNFILDTANFIGGGSIPSSLICLGNALAGLRVPEPISRAPLGAITLFSILKMIIGPVFGVLIVETFTRHTRLIDPNDKLLRFVCMYFSGVPTATSQVFLTQIYSPDGSAHHVAAFLVPQYALMFFTMTALAAYSLNILF